MHIKIINNVFIVILLSFATISLNAEIIITTSGNDKNKTFEVKTDFYNLKINFQNKIIDTEIISGNANELITDGNFNIDLMWTGWHAPRVLNNSENPVEYDKNDFTFVAYQVYDENPDSKTLNIDLKGKNNLPFNIRLTYKFYDNTLYFRRKIAISDTKNGKHFLRKITPVDYNIVNKNVDVMKKGGYGQPIAFTLDNTGFFFGLEYPASNNDIILNENSTTKLQCYQYIGEKISDKPISSEWVAIGVTPDKYIKKWFFEYLKDIRVAKLRPYILYNSWYDLEAPEMVKDEKNIMNEKNVLRIYNLFKKNIMEKYKLKLDAFVLDDGWDIYKSDWQLSKKQFPNGLRPISDVLKKDGVNLGIWFGPIGGYSHRDWRLRWMKDHGYETIGTQLCFGGKKYNELFKKRVVDFVKNDKAGYYKWDGFQFSCSQSDHGHPVGIYSRRYILNKLREVSDTVRKLNPGIFLNITSGTWLSPWWLKIADQIWMQGYDYGYANVPSISKRDAAMTYRDYVLYDDFKVNDLWFPISNLMTHGIIKGDLQKLGGQEEPLDKFTNNAVMYVARGVSMYELYITPDLLNEKEWNAIASVLKWGKENFNILSNNTEMIGGNPGDNKIYGYVHVKGNRGIIAVRNPFTYYKRIKLKLDPAWGLDPDATDLVIEQIYPYHKVLKKTYKPGDFVYLQVAQFETAVYEIYPLQEAKYPLITGAKFKQRKVGKNKIEITMYNCFSPKILNKDKVKNIYFNNKKIESLRNIPIKTDEEEIKEFIDKKVFKTFDFRYKPGKESKNIEIVFLYQSKDDKPLPNITLNLNGEVVTGTEFKQDNKWIWKKYKVKNKNHRGRFTIDNDDDNTDRIQVYAIEDQKLNNTKTVIIEMKDKIPVRSMLPEINDDGYQRKMLYIY
jgi:hypothetical protein